VLIVWLRANNPVGFHLREALVEGVNGHSPPLENSCPLKFKIKVRLKGKNFLGGTLFSGRHLRMHQKALKQSKFQTNKKYIYQMHHVVIPIIG